MASKVEQISSEDLRQKLLGLIEEFESKLIDDDLRAQVKYLVPVVHNLQKLGKSLIQDENASSARDRILLYLRKYNRQLIHGDELFVVAGIPQYARRIRELRKELGWPILSGKIVKAMIEADDGIDTVFDPKALKPNVYYLAEDKQDKEAAYRWGLANEIRTSKQSMKAKLLQFLRKNAGSPVTGEELAYVANKKSWARRSRELRTEDGWPVMTRVSGRPDLAVGVYILEEDKQAEPHDRQIPDSVRIRVLERDQYACKKCHWSHSTADPADRTRTILELHHIEHHVDGGANNVGNLITLCNVHHDDAHRGTLAAEDLAKLIE